MVKLIKNSSFFAFCLVCLSFFTDLGTSHANVICRVKIESAIMIPKANDSNNSGIFVQLKNTTGSTIPGTNWASGTVRGFYLDKSLGDQGLAIALTALSNKTKIRVNISGTATKESIIKSIGVTQAPQ
ncbi:MAG: hypothetical protein PHI97_16120 [Desulfobulbus sp.]|nr:hypothetical protein [Desulfobulbus sp.]